MGMTRYLDEIARFAAETSSEDLPIEVRDRTKLIMSDSIAAIVAGAGEPEVKALVARMATASTGSSLIIGAGRHVEPGLAALLNGSAGTFLEQDEGNQFCKGHPGMHTIPAVLACAAGKEVSGRDFLTAVTVGYEVGARIGIATNLRDSMHPHGTWGVICAAVGVARLLGFDAAQIKSLLNVASSLTLATSKKTMLEGGTVRNMYTGIAGQLGILACTLVEAGFTGEKDGLASVFGTVVSDSFDEGAMTGQLGQRWEVARNYFKLHSCCRYNHAALDALQVIISDHPDIYNVENIERIDIRTYSLAAELDDQSPKNTLAAKFSLPFAIATTLINQTSEYGSFTWEAVCNSTIQELAKQVYVTEDAEMSRALPDARPAHVTVKLRNGSILEAGTETNRGDWRDPYSEAELRVKYDKLTRRMWSREKSQNIYNEITALDRVESLNPLINALDQADQSTNAEKT